MMKRLYYRIFKRYRRIELKFINYYDADLLIKSGEGKPESEQWFIAKEEDNNRVIGWVYLERKERILK